MSRPSATRPPRPSFPGPHGAAPGPPDVDDPGAHGGRGRDAAAEVRRPDARTVAHACGDDEAVVGAEDDASLGDGRWHLDEAPTRNPMHDADRRAQTGGHEARSGGRRAEHRPARVGYRLPAERVGSRGGDGAAGERTALGSADGEEAEREPREQCREPHSREQPEGGDPSVERCHGWNLVTRSGTAERLGLGGNRLCAGKARSKRVGAVDPRGCLEAHERVVRLLEQRGCLPPSTLLEQPLGVLQLGHREPERDAVLAEARRPPT